MSTVDEAVLLREADLQLGHGEAPVGCISDPIDPSRIRHETHTTLTQRDYGIALG